MGIGRNGNWMHGNEREWECKKIHFRSSVTTTRATCVVKDRICAPHSGDATQNKAAIDRRLRPRCCHLISYFKRPVSCIPLACNWYYYPRFVTKPKTACALRFSWAATSSNLGSWANMTSSIKPEVRNLSLRRQRRTDSRLWVTCVKIGKNRTCSSEDMIADRQIHTQTRVLITVLRFATFFRCSCAENLELATRRCCFGQRRNATIREPPVTFLGQGPSPLI